MRKVKLIFSLVFGSDLLAKTMFEVFRLHKLATERHGRLKVLRDQVFKDELLLESTKLDYQDSRKNLENIYKLELD